MSQPPPLKPHAWMRPLPPERPLLAPALPRLWWCEQCERYVGRAGQDVCAACGGDDE